MGSSQSNNPKNNELNKRTTFVHFAPAIGVSLVIGGLLLFIDQKIQTHWIPISIPVIIGIITLVFGLISRKKGWIIAGLNIIGISGTFFLVFQTFYIADSIKLLALGLILFSLCWVGLFALIAGIFKRYYWWSFFIIFISLAVAISFLISKNVFLVYILSVGIAVGLAFLVWGTARNQLGLFIPGLLLITIGIGVFNGWSTVADVNGLRDTGIMLVWFSLGWILITVFSRIFYRRFIWWPLIPGGILAMVGSGLYIGGNPSNALGFLQNTGSIGLVLLGIYLILLKFGLNK